MKLIIPPGEMLYIFESHPVQYRAPLYQEMQKLRPNTFCVIYGAASAPFDRDFGKTIEWDRPLLDGYPHRILGNLQGDSLDAFSSLSGKGIFKLLKQDKPDKILLTQFNLAFNLCAYVSARVLDIPVWIRQETQDEAFVRSRIKTLGRSIVYRLLYSGVRRAFYIGELNKRHLKAYGIKEQQLTRAPYSVVNPFADMSTEDKQARRTKLRRQLNIGDDKIVVSFFGKLIPKKNPDLLVNSVELLTPDIRKHIQLLFVGTGRLEESLRNSVADNSALFVGFINQMKIGDYYLATDLLVLPSRRMGETWGLVVNEGLHAGCGIIMTDAVGSHAEFGNWERVRVIPIEDRQACANAIGDLASLKHCFEWCSSSMENYSIERAAQSLCQYL